METRINVIEAELPAVATALLQSLPTCAGGTILSFTGDLGAGKTTFVQYLATALGVEEAVNSPTFVLQKIYPTSHDRFTVLVHIDLYRLQTSAEAAILQLEQWATDPQVLLCVEWPDRVTAWPETACVQPVQMTVVSEMERELQLPGITLPVLS